jgi:membrane protease YdiL (CAAX protease family)
MLIPGAVAWILVRFVFGAPVAPALGVRRPAWRWLSIAWALAALVMVLSLALALGLPGVHYSPELEGLATLGIAPADVAALRARVTGVPGGAFVALLTQGLLLGPTLSLIGGLGEELGWRGYLFRELEPLDDWRRSALTGLLWGIWHLPAVLLGYGYPHHPLLGSVLLLGLTQILAPIYGRLRERSGSVFVPAVFHGTSSATSVVAVAFVGGGSELTTGFTGLTGLAASALVGGVFLFATRQPRVR